MRTQDFYRELECVFDIPAGSITGTEKLVDLGTWDSIMAISFIAMADSKLNAEVAANKLAACRTVADLVALLPGKVTT